MFVLKLEFIGFELDRHNLVYAPFWQIHTLSLRYFHTVCFLLLLLHFYFIIIIEFRFILFFFHLTWSQCAHYLNYNYYWLTRRIVRHKQEKKNTYFVWYKLRMIMINLEEKSFFYVLNKKLETNKCTYFHLFFVLFVCVCM